MPDRSLNPALIQDSPATVSDGTSLTAAGPEQLAPSDESELIRRILAGEKDLYYELVLPYQRPIYLMAVAMLHNEADAEDCMQEAMLKAYRHLSEFRGESRFGSWLIRITLNQAKMALRKARPGLYDSLDADTTDQNGEYHPPRFADWREIPSEALERKEIRETLETAINSLTDSHKQVFVLRDMQGMDIATTAQILGVSETVVKTRLLRARLRIRDMVAPLVRSSAVLSRQLFRKGRNPWA